jgi:sec-independent protein translocase protein TatB
VFNVGPVEALILAIVALIVVGPDRLPQLARDAARMLRTLRDMATGARQQLRDELGPEFADVDLRNLNPRTAVQRAVFGDDVPDLRKYDPRRFSPGSVVRDAIFGADEDEAGEAGEQPAGPVSMAKEAAPQAQPQAQQPPAQANGHRPRPRPRPGPGRSNYDDAT